jgi:hypothetical protein
VLQTKITVKIYTPLLADFGSKVDKLFMKRDAFLNNLIRGELLNLKQDLEGKLLSNRARQYVAGKLKRLETTYINVVVDRQTAKDLNDIVQQTNIVRDAFVNRLLFLFRASDAALRYLELPTKVNRSSFASNVESMPTSPMTALSEIISDPLYYLRVAAAERHNCGLYNLDLPESLDAFACHLDDSQVPGTDAFITAEQESQDLVEALAKFEAEALVPSTSPQVHRK